MIRDYVFGTVSDAMNLAVKHAKTDGSRMSVHICNCILANETHFVIKWGSSVAYLKWLNRNGQ